MCVWPPQVLPHPADSRPASSAASSLISQDSHTSSALPQQLKKAKYKYTACRMHHFKLVVTMPCCQGCHNQPTSHAGFSTPAPQAAPCCAAASHPAPAEGMPSVAVVLPCAGSALSTGPSSAASAASSLLLVAQSSAAPQPAVQPAASPSAVQRSAPPAAELSFFP